MQKFSIHSVPALVVATLFAVGIIVGKNVGLELWAYVAGAIGLFACVLVLISKSNQSNSSFVFPSLILLVILGGAAKYRFDATATPPLPESFLKKQITVVGKILESSATLENRTRFLFQLEAIQDSDVELLAPPNVLVTVIRQRKDSVDISFRYGNRIALTGQLYRPSG